MDGQRLGETVRRQLEFAHVVRFVLTVNDHERMSRLVEDALWPYYAKDPEHAVENYLDALSKIPTGLLVVNAINYDKLGSSDQVRWMDFDVTVTVPSTFDATGELKWTTAPCPAPPR